MLNTSDATARANSNREAKFTRVAVFTVRPIAKLMRNLKGIFNTVNIESFYSANVKRVGEWFTNGNVTIKLTGVVTEFTGATIATTIGFIDVFIL